MADDRAADQVRTFLLNWSSVRSSSDLLTMSSVRNEFCFEKVLLALLLQTVNANRCGFFRKCRSKPVIRFLYPPTKYYYKMQSSRNFDSSFVIDTLAVSAVIFTISSGK